MRTTKKRTKKPTLTDRVIALGVAFSAAMGNPPVENSRAARLGRAVFNQVRRGRIGWLPTTDAEIEMVNALLVHRAGPGGWNLV